MFKAFSLRFTLDAVSRVITFALNIFIARKLLVSDFGLLTYALSVANILYVFTEMGVNTYLLKEVGKDSNKLEEFWQEALFLKLFTSLILFVIAFIFIGRLWPWAKPWIFLAALGWMFGNSAADLYQTFCNAIHDFKLAAKLIIASRFILVFSMFVLFFLNMVSVSNVIFIYFAGSIIGAILAGYVFSKHLNVKYKLPLLSNSIKLFYLALPLGVANIFGMVYFRLDTVMLTWIKGSTETGIYGAAFRIYEMVYALPASLMVVATPMLSKAIEQDREKLLEVLRKVIIIACVISVFWLLTGFFGADLIINLLFGGRYSKAGDILRILVFANAAAFFSNIFTYMMAVLDKQNRHALNQGIVLVLSVLLNLIFIYQNGAIGAAWAVLITQLAILTLSLLTFFRKIKTI